MRKIFYIIKAWFNQSETWLRSVTPMA